MRDFRMETRSSLGDALRAWRDRVSPAAVGLPARLNRRVPGLRREELAALAGLSVDYLVRLEQGRATNPSISVIDALARALRLGIEERDVLYRSAGVSPPPPGRIPRHVPPGIQRMVDHLVSTPVAVFTASWDLLQWNDMWAALFGDPSDRTDRNRNVVWRHFTGNGPDIVRPDIETTAFEQGLVADLRAANGSYPDDAELTELIDDLRAISDTFAAYWDRFEMAPRIRTTKTILHPTVGAITVDCEILTAAATGSDLRVMVYTVDPDTPDADLLELIHVTGIQDLSHWAVRP